MPNIIAPAASQQSATPGAAALNHLAAVIGLLPRSRANAKAEQDTGARGWSVVCSLVGRAYHGAKTLLPWIGVVAVGGFLVLPLHLDGMLKLPMLAAEALFEPATTVAGPIQARAETPVEREQRALTEYIAKRYRVSEFAISGYVATAYRAGEQHSVDPLLILAVMAVQSRYHPVAGSILRAPGLMQVMPQNY